MKRGMLFNATLWKRMVAFLIDLFTINLVIAYPFRKFFAYNASYAEMYNYLMSSPAVAQQMTIIIMVISAFAILYFAFFEFHLGQTIGKMAMNIRVVSLEGDLNISQCLIRNFYLAPVFPFILLWIIDPLYVFFNPNRQRLTEWLSRTKVVEEVYYK